MKLTAFRTGLGASLALLLLIAGCGGGGGSPTAPAPTPVPTPTPLPYIGNWFGTTQQGKPISFAVASNGLTSVSTEFEVRGGGCTVTGTMKIDFTTPAAISGSTVTFNLTGSSIDISFRGTFTSASAASGDFTPTTKGSPCGGLSTTITWTATKS